MAVFLLLIGGFLRASTVELQEIPLSLYNKPVTGYRLTLDRSQRYVEQQILKHVAESDPKKPFQYERTIIFENIHYPPITTDQQISLHYLLRGYENHYTEITLVAMYDLRRSINTRDFPEMALKLQIDLARLVRKTSGDLMKFGDIVFDDNKIKELQGKMNGAPTLTSDPQATRTKVVVPAKGFEDTYPSGGNADSLIASLKRRIAELENREKEWLKQENNLRTQQFAVNENQAELQSKIAENNDLRDSVLALNKRMKSLLGQYYHSDDISVSNETAEYIDGLERENKRQERLIASLERANDSLAGLVRSNAQQMEGISKGRQGMADEIASLRASQSELRSTIDKLTEELSAKKASESSGSRADSLYLQLKSAQQLTASQAEELTAIKAEAGRLDKERDGLESQVASLQGRVRDLEAEVRRLESQGAAASKSTTDASLRDSLSSVQARLNSALAEKRTIEAAQANSDRKARALEDSLSASQKREATLSERLSKVQQQALISNNLQAENANLRDSLSRVNRRIAEMHARVNAQPHDQALADTLTAMRNREAELQKKLGQSRQQALAANSLQSENADLRDSLTRVNRRISEMHARVNAKPHDQALADTLSALRSREADLQKKLGQSRQQALAANSLQSENVDLRDSLTRLNRRVNDLGARLSTQEQNMALQDSLVAARKREQKLQARIQELNAQPQSDPVTEKENAALKDSLVVARKRTTDLQTRLADAEKRADAVARQSVNTEPSPETKALRDTVNLMRSRMTFLQTKLSEAETQAKQLETQANALKQKDSELRGVKEKLSETQTQLSGSQVERKRLEQSLYAAQASLKSAQDAAAASKAEQERLNKEKTALQARLTEAERSSGLDATTRKAMTDSIGGLHKRVRELESQVGARDKSIRAEIQRRDSLQRLLQQELNVENDLKRQLSLMQTKVDSLSRLSMPVQDQQKFIRDQWAKLTEWEKQLDSRAKTTENQEKLIAQKQTTLDSREKEVARRESAVTGLEERERQVRLREQQVNTRENLSGAEVNPADVKVGTSVEMGNIPVFSVQTMLNFRAAQKQVVAYMLSRDILLSEQIPDLVFKNVYISELSEGQMEVRVKVDSRSGGSLIHFSFKLANGNYLGDAQSVKMNESVKQFIVRMLRYKT